jgi:hypothetical protein
MKSKTKIVNSISDSDWDRLVQETYGRKYCLQQQDGCKDRGSVYLTVPKSCNDEESDMHDNVAEKVNGKDMGVKFSAWLDRDPNKLSGLIKDKWENSLFWERNFYPLLQTVANDLYKRGLLKRGKYVIDMGW